MASSRMFRIVYTAYATAAATSMMTSQRLCALNSMTFLIMAYSPVRASSAARMEDSESTRKFAEVTTRSISFNPERTS